MRAARADLYLASGRLSRHLAVPQLLGRPGVVRQGVWHHVAMTVASASEIRIYRDGTLRETIMPKGRSFKDNEDEHGKTMASLMTSKGDEFDRAYLKHEVAFHRAAIDAVRGLLLPSATCPELQEHFKNILPAFEHHLMLTQEISGKIAGR